MRIHSLNNVLLYKLFAVLFTIYPIFSLYKFYSFLTIGDLILFFLCLSSLLLSQNLSKTTDKSILVFLTILSLQNLIFGYVRDDTIGVINNTISIMKFGMIGYLLFTSGIFKISHLYKASVFVALVSVLFLFYQLFRYNFHGTIVSGRIFNLPLIDNVLKSENWGRFSSFYAEPAHFAIYLSPIFALVLIKKQYLISIVIMIGIILTSSATGVILVLLIVIYCVVFIFETNRISNIILLSLSIITFLLVYKFILSNDYNDYAEKFSVIYLVENIRFLGPLKYIQYFNLPDYLVGIGFNKLSSFALVNGLYVPNYANAFIYMFLSFGFLGLYVFVKYLRFLSKGLNKVSFLFFLILIFVLLSDQLLFNWNLMYLLIWTHVVKKSAEGDFLNA